MEKENYTNKVKDIALVSKMKSKFLCSFLFLLVIFCLNNCNNDVSDFPTQLNILDAVQETGKYTKKDSVAAYIHKFKKLPSNYVDKATGQSMYEQKGYVFSKWNFNPLEVLEVMIGGDYFGNNEGLLPNDNYKECDVDYHDDSRGTKRLVYTNAGIVYYTANHYEAFTLVY